MPIAVHSLLQPAIIVRNLDAGVDRIYELFKAVPSEKNNRPDFFNAVYAFGNDTYLEVLDGAHEGHTRMRFLNQFGPGLYMLCVDLAETDPAAVDAELKRLGIRVVAPGRRTDVVTAGWHLHPADAGNILVLHSIRTDHHDNTDWAGHKAAAYVSGNTRVVDQLAGVIARTADPTTEGKRFTDLGFTMAPLDSGAVGWRGPTGTIVELWPPTAWSGARLDGRRDYALCFATHDIDAAVARFAAAGLAGSAGPAGGRWLSEIDPVLGVRIAFEPA
jgi:hypothetical protein